MTAAASQPYAIYRTSATPDEPAGQVVDRIVRDGTGNWNPATGLAAVADPAGRYPIGSTYTATA